MRAVLCLLLLLPATAYSECPVIQPRVEHIAPASGATGVPQNVQVTFGTLPAFAAYDPAVVLTGSSGAIAGALIAGPAESWIFVPDDDLSPFASYTATITDALGGGAQRQIAFTTGTGSDVTAPVIPASPAIALGEYVAPVRTDDCQLPGYWSVFVDWPDATDAGPVLYSLQVDMVDLIDPGFAPIPLAITSTGSSRTLAVPEQTRLTVSVFAIDQAGRQAHTQPATFDTPFAPVGGGGNGGCNCELEPRDQRQAAWLGIAFALGLLALSQLALRRLLR